MLMFNIRYCAPALLSVLLAPAGSAGGGFPVIKNAAPAFETSAATVCNSDLIKPGYGCVSGELKDYGIYEDKYSLGLDSASRMLMLSEDLNKGNVYIYVYRADSGVDYDLIDLSTSLDMDDAGEYVESFRTGIELELVSESVSGFLCKYLIKGLTCSNDDPVRRYAVRQVYSTSGDSIDSIIPVAMQYIVQRGADGAYYSAVDSMNLNIVTDKEVFFSLMNKDKKMFQDYTIAFNTQIDLANIVKAEIVYDYQDFSCSTTIKNTIGDTAFSGLKNGFQGTKTCQSGTIEKGATQSGVVKLVEKNSVEFKARGSAFGAWTGTLPGLFNYLGSKKVYSWQTIEEIDSSMPDAFQSYKWLLHFSDPADSGFWFFFDWHSGFFPGFENYYQVKNAREVSQASILQLWYEDSGLIKKAIIADSYTDTTGNIPVDPVQNFSFFKAIINAWKNLFAGSAGFFDYTLVIISGIAGLVILGIVIKLLKFIISLFR